MKSVSPVRREWLADEVRTDWEAQRQGIVEAFYDDSVTRRKIQVR
jgi:hypothetical protein